MSDSKNILVVCVESIEDYPPVGTLCQALLSLGHRVTLSCCHGDMVPSELSDRDELSVVDLGSREAGTFGGLAHDLRVGRALKKLIDDNRDTYDVVWTTTDLAARDCGRALMGGPFAHVMQLMELVENTPAFSRRYSFPVKSDVVVDLARAAHRVVVPEYNRSFIQQAWWHLPFRPAVLPNKPLVDADVGISSLGFEHLPYLEFLRAERRRVLLYQGVFAPDRSLDGFIGAMRELGDGYALYLMGVRENKTGNAVRASIDGLDNVVAIPFVPAPQHLAYTSLGHIGLMPYRPSYNRESPLNALYCAPNKIWEYARFGLPMIGSEVPGLTTIFEREGIGVTCDVDDPTVIASAVRAVEADYEACSERSRAYFDSVDVVEIVRGILEGD